MVEALEVPLQRALGRDVGEVYAAIHKSEGVDVRTGTTVQEWHASGDRVTGVSLSDGSRHEVDLALVAVGIEPNLEVPRALGLAIEGGGVRVDEALGADLNRGRAREQKLDHVLTGLHAADSGDRHVGQRAMNLIAHSKRDRFYCGA